MTFIKVVKVIECIFLREIVVFEYPNFTNFFFAKYYYVHTCSTGVVTKYFSRKALGERSYDKQVDKCCKIESTECLGCCLVTLRYFCNGLETVGNIA